MKVVVIEEVERKESFWGLFDEPLKEDGVSGLQSSDEKQKEDEAIEAMRAIFPHLRRIGLYRFVLLYSLNNEPFFSPSRTTVHNTFRLLYIVVRPVMLFVLWHRRVLMDWEKPGTTVLFIVVYFWSWWKEVQLAALMTYMFGKLWRKKKKSAKGKNEICCCLSFCVSSFSLFFSRKTSVLQRLEQSAGR